MGIQCSFNKTYLKETRRQMGVRIFESGLMRVNYLRILVLALGTVWALANAILLRNTFDLPFINAEERRQRADDIPLVYCIS